MSAKIYSFPNLVQNKATYRLKLYNDLEVEAVLTCVNVFSVLDEKINYKNITDLDPRIVVECLKAGMESWIFSDEFKKTFSLIISNLQVE